MNRIITLFVKFCLFTISGNQFINVCEISGINCEEAFHTLTAAMRERLTASSMNSDESDDNEVCWMRQYPVSNLYANISPNNKTFF